jgi:hypothetical protein
MWNLFVGKHHPSDASAELAAIAAGLGAGGYTGFPVDGVWYGDVATGTARMYRAEAGGWGPLILWDLNGLTVGSTPTIQKVIEDGTLKFKVVDGSVGYQLLSPEAVNRILEQAQSNALAGMRRRHHYGLVYGSFDSAALPTTGQYYASSSTNEEPTLKTRIGFAYDFSGGVLQAAFLPADPTGMTEWDAANDEPSDGIVLATSEAEVAVKINVVLDYIYEIQNSLVEAAGPGNTVGFAIWDAANTAIPSVGSFVASSVITIEPEAGIKKNEIYAFGTKQENGAWVADGKVTLVSVDGIQQSDLFSLSGDVDRDNVQDEGEKLNTLYEFQPTEIGLAWASATTIQWEDIETVITEAIASRITSAEAEAIATQIYYQNIQEGIIDFNPNLGPSSGANVGIPLVSPIASWKVIQNATLAQRGFNWYTVEGGGAGNWLPR